MLLERLLESLGLRNLLESLEGRQALQIHRKTLVISPLPPPRALPHTCTETTEI